MTKRFLMLLGGVVLLAVPCCNLTSEQLTSLAIAVLPIILA